MTQNEPIVVMKGITIEFPGVKARTVSIFVSTPVRSTP